MNEQQEKLHKAFEPWTDKLDRLTRQEREIMKIANSFTGKHIRFHNATKTCERDGTVQSFDVKDGKFRVKCDGYEGMFLIPFENVIDVIKSQGNEKDGE